MGQMVVLTEGEWERYREKWRKEKGAGFRVLVKGTSPDYKKSRGQKVVLQEYILSRDGVWHQ